MPLLMRSRYSVIAVVLGLAAAPPVAAQLGSDVTVADGRPGGGLSVSVFSAAYQATTTHATVVVGTEVQGLLERETRANVREPRRLEVRYALSGGPAAVPEQTVVVPLDDEAAFSRARREGVRVLTRLTIAPGRYQLRITARDIGSQSSGLVAHDVDVPQLAGPAPISVSGLVLTSSSVSGLTHAEVEDDHRMLPILGQPPSARRAFSQAERVEVHAEFYEELMTEPEFDQQINVITRVRSAGGDVMWEIKENGTSEALPGGRFGYVHSMLLPVSTLAPGKYVVEVGAETLYGVPGYVSRSLPFAILATR